MGDIFLERYLSLLCCRSSLREDYRAKEEKKNGQKFSKMIPIREQVCSISSRDEEAGKRIRDKDVSSGTNNSSRDEGMMYISDECIKHCFLVMDDSMRQKLLKRIHDNFHTDNAKVVKIMRRAGYPEELCKAMMFYRCKACESFSQPSLRPVVSTMKSTAFSHYLEIGLLVYRKGVNILHCVCVFARLSAGDVLPDRSSQSLIDGFICSWLVHYGPPKRLTYDLEGGFASENFLSFCYSLNIECRAVSKDSHHKIGCVERHNAILQQKIDRISAQSEFDEESGSKKMSFRTKVLIAFASKNAMIQKDGLNAIEVALGNQKSSEGMSPFVAASDMVKERIKALEETRKHRMTYDAKERMQRLLNRRHPSKTVCLQYRYGEYVDAYNKSSKLWEGPFLVIFQDPNHKKVYVQKGDRLYTVELKTFDTTSSSLKLSGK